MTSLSYIVLYTRDLERLRLFYESLGLTFVRERHGAGPEHYSATTKEGLVLELYPGMSATGRLGFTVKSVKKTMEELARNGFSPIGSDMPSSGKNSLLIRDPDGRHIELTNAK